MPIVVLTVLGVVAFVALLVTFSSVGPFLAVRRFHGATVTSIAALTKGSAVTLRGTVTGARRPPPYPRLTPGDVVFSELTVVEQVGKQTNTAFRAKAAQVFTLRDEAGGEIDVDPAMVTVADAHETSAKDSKVSREFKNYINQQGSWRWPNTPATCHEDAIVVGDVVTLTGQVTLPLPGQVQDGDTELRVAAREMSLYQADPWNGRSGKTLKFSALAFVGAMLGCLGCVAWAGWL